MEILKHPNPTLFEPSHAVREMDEELKAFIVEMISTMKKNGGMGLAAPQVGVLKKIIVMEIEGWTRIMINPVIRTYSDIRVSIEEGCLSCPEKVFVKRSPVIRVEYKDIHWNRKRETLEGVRAVVTQHECDHLEGITIIERASKDRSEG